MNWSRSWSVLRFRKAARSGLVIRYEVGPLIHSRNRSASLGVAPLAGIDKKRVNSPKSTARILPVAKLTRVIPTLQRLAPRIGGGAPYDPIPVRSRNLHRQLRVRPAERRARNPSTPSNNQRRFG